MSNQLEQIELQIDDAKDAINRKDALQRLMDNPDFKAVITEGYFKEEAARLVWLRQDPNFSEDKMQKSLLTSIDGISSLRQYLSGIQGMGHQAEKALKDFYETREEIIEEEANEAA